MKIKHSRIIDIGLKHFMGSTTTTLLNTMDNLPEEKTEVIYGPENIIKINNELWLELNKDADICVDKNVPYSYFGFQ